MGYSRDCFFDVSARREYVCIEMGHFKDVPSKNRGVPHISLVFREMWETTALHVPLSKVGKRVKVRRLPHLAKNERDMGHPTILGRERARRVYCCWNKSLSGEHNSSNAHLW
jgi:hypothetical protein